MSEAETGSDPTGAVPAASRLADLLVAADEQVRQAHEALLRAVGNVYDYGVALDAYLSSLAALGQLSEGLRSGGEAELTAARRLLDGGPCREWPDGNGGWLGVGLAAVAVLGAYGQPADAGRLRSVVLRAAEPPRTRLRAALAWHGLAGPAALPAILVHLLVELPTGLEPADLAPLGDEAVPHLLPLLHERPHLVIERALDLLAALPLSAPASVMAPLLSLLAHPEYGVRHRATELLVRLGDVAQEPLVEYLWSTHGFAATSNAEDALRRISPMALELLREEQARASHGLSRAAPATDATRGLSRAGDGSSL